MQASQAFKASMKKALPRNGLVLTLDDGYADMHAIIRPRLIKRS